jgi:hypothetical protein
MVVENKVIPAAAWYKISVVLATTIFFGVTFGLFYRHGFSWAASISLPLPIVGVLAVYEVFSSRVTLSGSSMDIVGLLGKRSFERSRISTVKVDGGSVFVEIEGGGWVKLPELGRNKLSMSNTIRAWLRRG